MYGFQSLRLDFPTPTLLLSAWDFVTHRLSQDPCEEKTTSHDERAIAAAFALKLAMRSSNQGQARRNPPCAF